MLDRVADLPPSDAGIQFSDARDIPGWATESVASACTNGLFTVNKDGAFEPNKPLTSAEADLAIAKASSIKGRPWYSKLIQTTSHDGFELTGRLCLPEGDETVGKVVVLVNGTGPSTYETKGLQPPYRYKYYDYFADQFAAEHTAFFSYNTRGVQLTEENPYYTINWDVYGTYTPQNCAKDVVTFIKDIKDFKVTKDAEIVLLGWSEGAIVAPLAALEPDNGIDALLLAGYPDMNMKEILDWQLDGAQTLFYYTIAFDAEGQTSITKAQYEADPYGVIGVSPLVYDMSFDELDANKNDVIDVEDFAGLPRAQLHQALLSAIERNDTEWIVQNFLPLPAGWFKAHFALGKTGDILTKVRDMPIHIFQGTYDLNCPVQGAYDVQAQFNALGLTNLQVHVFDGLDHSLGFDYWLLSGENSEGYTSIFDTARGL
ncbi:S-layer homology domain-containing protein [Sporobacter termitidis]|nr:S-layer homology domain-containing protein [Sporobacter termitidis]